MIYEVSTYTNDKNLLVQKRTPVLDATYAAIGVGPKFIGTSVVMAKTPQGKFPKAIEFPIEAATIQEAFDKFEPDLKKFIESNNNNNRIVIPGAKI